MEKQISKCGYKVSKLDFYQVHTVSHGACICDSCSNFMIDGGTLIYVLNQIMCPTCYEEWNDKAKFYKADVPFEDTIIRRYDKLDI